jgi:hypothetical protein
MKMNYPEIRLLQNKDIDRQKWDQCISNSPNSRVYAYCWYLDIVCYNWPAIIVGDYEYIMPLPFFRKFGISYLSQPVYAQQLGVFPKPPETILTAMLNFLIGRYNYIRISLNSNNISQHKGFEITERRNYILPLDCTSLEITGRYHKNTNRNIQKSKKSALIIRPIFADEYMKLKHAFPGVEGKNDFLQTLNLIMTTAQERQQGIISGAYSPENELLAATFYLFDDKRAYYLNAVSSDSGKDLRAAYAITDQFIQDHAGRKLVLDFEGSQDPGVARFYEGFGAICENYLHLYRNTLVWPLSVLKK